MSKFEPTYAKGEQIKNVQYSEMYRIIDMEYSKRMCDIVYKIQHCRNKFDMTTIPETMIERNIEKGNYEVVV
ncbi:hypothetical protein [His2 virus]|uniref:Uncharacterized protein n=1 Tax=His 2 virus TaxID=128710 RepID=Q25BE7_HIS2V|nr:hypothetical protein His2V_gp13 [His2 virus]AAQ13775.1 hypothetical protein [His2 virus]